MIVLDASALVDIVVGQTWRDEILEHLDQPVISPSHQLAEVLSALARLQRSGQLSSTDAREALTEAVDLRQSVVSPDARQLRRALELAERIRVLDGLYVALAEARSCPLLTSDGRLAGADPPCEVILVPADAP